MHRSFLSILSLSLVLLLAAATPLGQTASAQESETSAFDVDKPMISLREADLSTEQQRVHVATQLLKARANTKIGYSTYRDGVQYFKEHHPQFYGNFFGDPFYATFDVNYLQMARHRSLASIEAAPLTGLPGLFACNPVSYDPAFGGDCEGLQDVSSAFFILPFGISPDRISPYLRQRAKRHCSQTIAMGLCMHTVDFAGLLESDTFNGSRQSHAHHDTGDQEQRGTVGDPLPRDIPPSMENRPSENAENTKRISSTNASSSSPSVGGGERAKVPERIEHTSPSVRRIEVPATVDASLQHKASSLKRTEAKLRLQQQIRQKYGGRKNLSPRERARLTSRLGETTYLEGERSGVPGRPGGEQADAPAGNHGSSRTHQETASRSEKIERAIGQLAREADRLNSNPSGSSHLPNIDLPNADRPKRPGDVDLPDLEEPNLPRESPDAPSASGPSSPPDLDPPKRERKRRIESKSGNSEDSGKDERL